ncbi:condensation domain-containing protein [Clostridiaceae bacterium M8S5]|nr:condensation domain-containing protein [Clostridiaceae bacterium M8S5]
MEMLDKCLRDGIKLWVEGEKLKYKAQEGKMTQEVINFLRQNKSEIIQYLKETKNNTCKLTPIQHAYLIGRKKEYELGNLGAHYYGEYRLEHIDIDKLENAINMVVDNHEILRTIIYSDSTQKVINPTEKVKVLFAEKVDDQELKEIRNKWSHHTYEIGGWPMFDVVVSKTIEDYFILHLSFDCMILDGWSAGIMLDEIFKVYYGEQVNRPSFTFKEYVKNEEEWLNNNSNNKEAKEYWGNILPHIPDSPKLKYKRELINIDKPHFDRIKHDLSKTESQVFLKKCKENRFTPSAVLLTAYMKLLSTLSEERDITVNLTLFKRVPMNKEVHQVLGDFTNVGLASYKYDDSNTFLDEVNNIQKQIWQLVKYRYYNGVKLIQELSRNKPGKAVMPVVFTSILQGKLDKKTYYPEGFKEIYAISQTPQVALDHQVYDINGTIALAWDYVVEAFSNTQIKNMFEEYINLVEKLIYKDDWQKIDMDT